MQEPDIDARWLHDTLLELLAIPSPSGLTDAIVHDTGERLDAIGIPYVLTRRGTIRAVLRRTLPERRRGGRAPRHAGRDGLCEAHGIPAQRDVFRFHTSVAGAALGAGHDVRTALPCSGADASHGHERTHLSTLVHLATLLALYIRAGPTLPAERERLRGSVEHFPQQVEPPPPAPDATRD
jgi:putative aminopeptidase FrvX